MTQTTMTTPRPGKGRRRIEDRGEILAHFAAEIAKRRTVSEIAGAGLEIKGWRRTPGVDGWSLVVVRRLSGTTLERRYWQARAEADRPMALAKNLEGSRYIGIQAPTEPASFPKMAGRGRGRPRKRRRG